MSHSHVQRLVSYTKLLAAHVNQGDHEKALALFNYMHSTPDLSLNPYGFPLALKSCSALHRTQLGRSIHALTAKSSLLSHPFVACALVVLYGKCVSITEARKMFDEIPQRNVVVWNSMISLYGQSKDVSRALEMFGLMDVEPNASTFNSIMGALSLSDDGSSKAFTFYRRMQEYGVKPNIITVFALLRASVGLAALNPVKEIHGHTMRTFMDSNTHLCSNLLEAYGRCGCLRNACSIFDRMSERDVVVWSSMISAYAFHGEAKKALDTFEQMEAVKVKPNEVTFLGVLKACSHAGLADEAHNYISRMRQDYGVDAGSDHYACLVDVLSRAGRLYEAYEVIREMPVKATAKAWGALLCACRSYGNVELAEIAGRVLFDIEPENAGNYVLLSSVYAGVGRQDEAERVRREMSENGVEACPRSSWVV